jgi:hypothetical protein
MKKILLTLLLATASAVSYGQGTIAFGNTIASRIKYQAAPGGAIVDMPITFRANFAVFFSTSSSNPNELQIGNTVLGTSSASSAGIIVAAGTYAITGGGELATVFMQVRGWDAAFGTDWAAAKAAGAAFGQTDVRSVTLASALGPGTAIWQSATATDPKKFNPFVVAVVPEPSTIALGVLGLGSLLFFRRRTVAK